MSECGLLGLWLVAYVVTDCCLIVGFYVFLVCGVGWLPVIGFS